jgi:DNA-binding LacI/PurR family transcriptional regulator
VARAAHVLTVMMHLMRRGKRIPQDIAVLSRDNDPILEATSPSVARYGIQPKQLANRIASALRQLADTGTLESHNIRLMPEYQTGDSI